MKTTKEKIDIMQAYEDGRIIEYRILNEINGEFRIWDLSDDPIWNWSDFEYRIKEEHKGGELMTERQLAELLAKGYGEVAQTPDASSFTTVTVSYKYALVEGDYRVDESIKFRAWGSDDWIRPTVDVYEGFVRKEDDVCVSK